MFRPLLAILRIRSEHYKRITLHMSFELKLAVLYHKGTYTSIRNQC
jgi:hypothetical protein